VKAGNLGLPINGFAGEELDRFVGNLRVEMLFCTVAT